MAERKTQTLPLLLAAATGLVGGAAGALLFPPQVVQMESTGPGAADRLADLEQRLAALEILMDQVAVEFLARTGGDGGVAAGARQPAIGAGSASDAAELERQLAALMARLAELEAATGGTPAPGEAFDHFLQRRDPSGQPEGIEANRQRILSDAPVADKLAAWRALRGMGPDAWSDPVVQEMVRIGQTSEDADVRADVWRQADAKARHPAIKQALLDAVVRDPAGAVRGEAAETLENYCHDPAVVAALEQIAIRDPDAEVRENANKALRKWRESQEDDRQRQDRK